MIAVCCAWTACKSPKEWCLNQFWMERQLELLLSSVKPQKNYTSERRSQTCNDYRREHRLEEPSVGLNSWEDFPHQTNGSILSVLMIWFRDHQAEHKQDLYRAVDWLSNAGIEPNEHNDEPTWQQHDINSSLKNSWHPDHERWQAQWSGTPKSLTKSTRNTTTRTCNNSRRSTVRQKTW